MKYDVIIIGATSIMITERVAAQMT